jgi:hypothetical protein
MHHTLLLYLAPEQISSRHEEGKRAVFWGAFGPYLQAMQDAGVFVAGGGLQPPSTAATVTLESGQVQDGPYADSKEQLAGYIVIDVADMDAALGWAARYPAAIGRKVEVRPNLPPRP